MHNGYLYNEQLYNGMCTIDTCTTDVWKKDTCTIGQLYNRATEKNGRFYKRTFVQQTFEKRIIEQPNSWKRIFVQTKHLWPFVQSRFPTQRVSSAELWSFVCCWSTQDTEQTVQLPVIWYALTLMWRHCNASLKGKCSHIDEFFIIACTGSCH